MPLATKYTILLGYTIFLMVFLGIETGLGVNFLGGNVPIPRKPVCNLGFVIIDGLFDCAWQYLQPLFIFFDYTTSIGLFNLAILIPYLVFMTYLIITTSRGVA